jgi:AcrR family transcriptional regulator
MVRWEPGTLERLQLSAIELFEERGYDSTTVADIAARAGLTERTFYRHFADKREVLVSGSDELASVFRTTVSAQPEGTAPLAAVAAALQAVGTFFEARRPFSKRRQAVIASSRDLQERELAKLDALTATLTDALGSRGVDRPLASLVAAVGVALFHVAFGQWISGPDGHTFNSYVARALDDLQSQVPVRQ